MVPDLFYYALFRLSGSSQSVGRFCSVGNIIAFLGGKVVGAPIFFLGGTLPVCSDGGLSLRFCPYPHYHSDATSQGLTVKPLCMGLVSEITIWTDNPITGLV